MIMSQTRFPGIVTTISRNEVKKNYMICHIARSNLPHKDSLSNWFDAISPIFITQFKCEKLYRNNHKSYFVDDNYFAVTSENSMVFFLLSFLRWAAYTLLRTHFSSILFISSHVSNLEIPGWRKSGIPWFEQTSRIEKEEKYQVELTLGFPFTDLNLFGNFMIHILCK